MTLLSDAPQPGRERLTDERKILGTRERIVLEVEFNQNRLISRWRSRDLSGAVQRAGGNTCGWQPMCGGQSAPPGFREPAYGRFLRFRSSD
ncbi:hypothetical protein D1114_20745 [Cereibacter sphaeroides]|uniref:Uncharacterized protein n=1 Tax=Cereibacter sphaeroides TaxID=1063 RepID=A0AAX1UG81_CERSP|nr:hypothetical protein [Cereibacter sphaeroides]RDS93387.1 hypothetical protein DWF04_23195 [Cereibacter sphaeroides f. sp. denitrificans]RHZ91189.1 hypothetical protein D1114_20745 [Cereibacter sphaeroides]